MAFEEHYGVEISKADFSGGLETVRFFERLGFHFNDKIREAVKNGEYVLKTKA